MLLLLSLCWVGCSRPGNNQGTADAGEHQVPFREAGQSETADLSPTVSSAVVQNGPYADIGVPFRDPHSLPVGTLLTVRLKDPISSDRSGSSTIFTAVVDEPIVIEGETMVPRGSSVTGRVESAHPSMVNRSQGYVRLSLDAVDVDGRDMPIRTSSLFARGRMDEPQTPDAEAVVGVEQGRRLTFRLTEPVFMVSKVVIPGR